MDVNKFLYRSGKIQFTQHFITETLTYRVLQYACWFNLDSAPRPTRENLWEPCVLNITDYS